ncbi:MAG: neutral zinc metallopeptidase [Bacteroidales bacterium]
MRWQNQRRSENVEDRRKLGKPLALAGGGMAVIVAVIMMILGKDPTSVLQIMQEGGQTGSEVVQTSPHEDSLAEMTSAVLASTEDVWQSIFQKNGMDYTKPKLVLFTGSVQSACGFAQAAMGPFYCSGDSKVYLDLSFFDELGSKLGASGDFAQAYVIAHEVGHHIQNLLGTMDEVHTQQDRVSEKARNELSVRLELQADFYAGIWAHYADKTMRMLETGDLEEALNAASQIGDDRLQKQSQGYVVPDSFTHGTSAQRLKWFLKGYKSGDAGEARLLFELKNL